jgi:hypothetical protein
MDMWTLNIGVQKPNEEELAPSTSRIQCFWKKGDLLVIQLAKLL